MTDPCPVCDRSWVWTRKYPSEPADVVSVSCDDVDRFCLGTEWVYAHTTPIGGGA